jgi:DNA-binding transcriptional LysR family regulator
MLRTKLTTFLKICDTGSFSKAAEALYITPSAVLQQVRSLESELNVTLFDRTSRGVSMTPAGEYLERRGRALVQTYEEIQRDINAISNVEKSICIGSSMLEKCRLLYDLWVLFSEKEKDYRIQMENIDIAHNISPSIDLLESINSNIGWMRDWDFFEICKVPFGFAFAKDHPLAGKNIITLEDLRGQTVVSINDGSCDTVISLLELLRRSDIHVVINYGSGMNMFWESAFQGTVQVVPLCWHDILANMTVIPFAEKFSLPYGIFYRTDPRPTVQKFLDFIKLTYGEGNDRGIVPVLS